MILKRLLITKELTCQLATSELGLVAANPAAASSSDKSVGVRSQGRGGKDGPPADKSWLRGGGIRFISF